MGTIIPAPNSVAQKVNDYLDGERLDCQKYDNRKLLDQSGVYSLHSLAREVYGIGWSEGFAAALTVQRSVDAAKASE